MKKERNPLYLIIAILMLLFIYPAYLKNGLFGACFVFIAFVANLLNYFIQ